MARQTNEELEGITVWDLDYGNAPRIEGQVHLIMLDNDWRESIFSDNDLYFKHFRVPVELPLSGVEDCLPVNYQNLQVKKDWSMLVLSCGGIQILGPFKSEVEA